MAVQILMHDLDSDAMRPFYRGPEFVSSRHSSKVSGIADLVPGAELDDLVFDPCGYSSNGLLEDSYFTIHVTPQPYCSFASFETNLPQANYTQLINRVVAVFKPRRFQISLFANDTAVCGKSYGAFEPKKILGYKRLALTFHQFDHYDLSVAQFVRHA